MNIKTKLKGLAALALMGGALLHAGEEGFGVDLNLRTSYNFTTNDNLNNAGLGFGLNFRNTFNWGTLNAEVGYYYNPGRGYRAALLPSYPGQPAADPANSADSRQNHLDQINLRLSYENEINSDWTWRAGLIAGNAKFRHQYIADLADGPDTTATVEETYNGTPTKSQMSVSPFVGLGYRINKDSAFEFNLVSQAYTAIDFKHTPFSPIVSGDPSKPGSHLVYAGDHLAETKRNTLRLELGYTFRF